MNKITFYNRTMLYTRHGRPCHVCIDTSLKLLISFWSSRQSLRSVTNLQILASSGYKNKVEFWHTSIKSFIATSALKFTAYIKETILKRCKQTNKSKQTPKARIFNSLDNSKHGGLKIIKETQYGTGRRFSPLSQACTVAPVPGSAGRYWRYFDISRYQNFTILVSCRPRYFLVSRYQKYRDTFRYFLSILHLTKPFNTLFW